MSGVTNSTMILQSRKRYSPNVTTIKWVIQDFKVGNSKLFSKEFNIDGHPNKTWVMELVNLKNSTQDNSDFMFLLSDSSDTQVLRTQQIRKKGKLLLQTLSSMDLSKVKLTIGQNPKERTFSKLGYNLELNHTIKGSELRELVTAETNCLHVTLKIKPPRAMKLIDFPLITRKLNFETFFNNSTHSDVCFRINNNEFHAHKVILASASTAFERIFTHQMQENNKSIAVIRDTNPNHFKELLRFIYMGRVENLENNVNDLFKLAYKYNVPNLQQTCEIQFERNFSINNAIGIYELADSHNSQNLKEKCIEYIDRNFEQIKNTEAFKSLKAELLVEFVCAIRIKRPRTS